MADISPQDIKDLRLAAAIEKLSAGRTLSKEENETLKEAEAGGVPAKPEIATGLAHAAALLGVPIGRVKRARAEIPEAFNFTGGGRINLTALRAHLGTEAKQSRPRESMDEAELRNIQATYRRREFELAVRKKEFTKTSEVILLHTRLTLACRARLLAVGPSLAQRLAITTEPAECERLITEKQIEALAELCKCEWAEPTKKPQKKTKKRKKK